MASYASATGTRYSLDSVAGNLYSQGMNQLADIGNRYKNNETVSGLVTGAFVDTARTAANSALALQYNDAFQGTMYRNQSALEELRTGNAMKLMAAEGGINKDLLAVSGDQDRLSARVAGQEDRLSRQTQGTEDRATKETEGAQDRLSRQTQGTEDRLTRGVEGEQERLNIGARGMMDRALERTRGEQQRLGQDNESLNVVRLREDARGAIRKAGTSFYG